MQKFHNEETPIISSPTLNHMSRVGDLLFPNFVRTLILMTQPSAVFAGRRSQPRLLDIVEDKRYWIKGR